MILCIVKDRLSGLPETQPLAFPNKETAINAFSKFCNNEKIVRKEEFCLIKIGSYDEEKAIITDTIQETLSLGHQVDQQLDEIMNRLRSE